VLLLARPQNDGGRTKPGIPTRSTTSGVTVIGSSTLRIKTAMRSVSDPATAEEVLRNG
jgi:hypothetical protein